MGFIIVKRAAIDEIAPRVPTWLGLSLVKPKAVSGMNRSQEFFNVSTKTSLWQFTVIHACFMAIPQSNFIVVLLSSSDGLVIVALLSSRTFNIS